MTTFEADCEQCAWFFDDEELHDVIEASEEHQREFLHYVDLRQKAGGSA